MAALTAEPSQGAELRPPLLPWPRELPEEDPQALYPLQWVLWLIDSEAVANGVSRWLMHDIAWAESRYDPDAYRRDTRASGVFQFIPSTWREASAVADGGFWRNFTPFHPPANISVAAWVMSQPYPWGTRHWGR